MSVYLSGLKTAIETGGAWTDISPYLYDRASPGSVTMTGGHGDETSQITPVQVAGELNNRDYRFTASNPAGAYYPGFGRNTPLRMSLPAASSYLRIAYDVLTSYVSCPDATGLQLTGNIDVRIDVDLDDYQACSLCYKFGGSGQSWRLELQGDGTLLFTWYDGSASHSLPSTMPVPLGRLIVRATLTVATGTVTFYTGTGGSMSGSYTQLGRTATIGTATSLSAGTGQVIIVGHNSIDAGGQSLQGKVYEFRLINASGSVVADPLFTLQTEGATSFTDSQSNTWTLHGTAEISARAYLCHAEMSSLPVSWDPSGRNVWLPFQAGGVLRRLTQGNAPILSPMRRAVLDLSGSVAAVAYWPGEDVAGSSQLASGLSGGNPMTFAGTPALAADSTFACSAALPQVQSSAWSGLVSYPGTWTDNVTRFLLSEAAGTVPASSVLMSVYTTGSVARTDLIYTGTGGLELKGYSASEGLLFNSSPGIFGIDGALCRISVNLLTTGIASGHVGWEIEVYTIGATEALTLSGTISGSIGAVTQVSVNPLLAALGDTVVGHISVEPQWESLFDVEGNVASDGSLTGPLRAWAGEYAGNRLVRLCNENDVTPRVYGSPDVTQPMGAQTIDTLPNLLQTIEDTDRGLLYEPAEVRGIGYRTLASLCAQSPKLTLDYSLGQAGDQESATVSLVSTEDDLYTTNWWIVSATAGSSAQAVLDDGSAMSVSDPSAGGLGPYQNTKQVVTYTDSQLQPIADWMLNVSTVDEPRYKSVTAGLHNPAVVAAGLGTTILTVRPGDLVEIVNTPAWLPPGPVQALAAGNGTKLTTRLTQATWNTVPASPYATGVLDASGYAIDTDSCQLGAPATSGATALYFMTPAGVAPWTTTAGDFPFDVTVGGERMTVTAMSAVTGNWLTGQNTGFEGGLGTWAAQTNCTIADSAAQAHSGSDSQAMTSSAAGTMQSSHCLYANAPTGGLPVNPGDTVKASGWFRAAVSARTCQIVVVWFSAAGTDLSQTGVGTITDSTSAWTQSTGSVTAPAGAAVAVAVSQVQGTGGASEVHYDDDVTLANATSKIQAATVTRSVNGVVKAHSAGEAVNVAQPLIVTLT